MAGSIASHFCATEPCGPGVGDFYDLDMSLANDTLTVLYDGEQVASFHPKDEGEEWPGSGDAPEGATGLALGGSNCYGSGAIQADFVELRGHR